MLLVTFLEPKLVTSNFQCYWRSCLAQTKVTACYWKLLGFEFRKILHPNIYPKMTHNLGGVRGFSTCAGQCFCSDCRSLKQICNVASLAQLYATDVCTHARAPFSFSTHNPTNAFSRLQRYSLYSNRCAVAVAT